MSSTNSENDDKLLNAAWKGDNATVSQLLTQGHVNVDARSEAGWTALYWASCRGHTDVVDLLAQARADTEAGDCDNATPLHKACEHGFVDTVRVLLVHGANASIQDNWGNKPIHMPLTNGSLGMHALCYTIRELVQHGAEWDDRCDHIVRQRPSRAGIRACIDLWSMEARQGMPLTNIPIEVIVRGDPAVRQYLSNIGPPASGGLTNWLLDSHDDTTFDNTMDTTRDDMVHTGMDQTSWTTNEMVGTRYTHNNLSNSGIDQYTSSVVVRPMNGVPRQIDVVPHLSDAGNSSLHDACVEGSLDMVRLLLETGADVNATNDAGLKPLHCALWKRRVSNQYELNGVFYLLANNGATWDATCDEMEQNLNTIYWAASVKRCMQWWETEKRHGRELIEVPFEAQDGGNFDIDLYINNKIAERQRAETPPQHGVMFGRNVSNSKRERHQNVLALKVTVVGSRHKARDVIVESLVALKTVEPSYPMEDDHPLRVGVSRLSFSGYSHGNRPPNHHEVCVWDVHATEETMHACAMFFTRRALYMLCVDLVEFEQVHLTGNDDDVQQFIQQHVLQWFKLIKKYHPNAQIVIAGTFTEGISDDITDQETALQNLQDSLATHQNLIGKCDWLAVGCDSVAQVLQARAQLESLIIQSKNNVALDEAAATALDFTWELSNQLSSLENSQLLEQGMSSLEDMRSELASALSTEGSSTTSQDVLEKIAPIAPFLWYNIDGELLQAVVFGSPNVPTSYFNEILTHQSRDGESISHEAIMALPSWSTLTDNSVLALKQLLHRFEVVHALDEVIASDSKLLVPSYWKRSQHADTNFELASKPTINVHWHYQVTNLSPTTFDRLVVASYSPLFRRHIGDHYLLFKPSDDFVCRVRVTFGTGGTQRSVIHLEAQAANASSPMWCVFQHVGEAIERVVRGHDVTRLAFNDVGGDDRLETIVAEWVKSPPPFRATLTWLPPDLTWVYNRLLAKCT